MPSTRSLVAAAVPLAHHPVTQIPTPRLRISPSSAAYYPSSSQIIAAQASSTSQALSFIQYLLYVSSVQHLHLISEAGTSPPRQTVQPTCGWLPSLISVRRIETPRGRRCGNRARGLLNTGRLGGVFREGCGESEGSSILVGWAESFVKEAGSRRNAWYRPVGWKSTLGYQWEGCSISLDGCISC